MFPELQVQATGEIPDLVLLPGEEGPEVSYFSRVKFHLYDTVDH